MSHNNLTRWIEDAEARIVSENAIFERRWNATESHYLHLGETIAKVPSWIRHGIDPETLEAIGCHALAYVRHPLSRARQ
jgi:hypothetical protein